MPDSFIFGNLFNVHDLITMDGAPERANEIEIS
jgi:hypothetical protein